MDFYNQRLKPSENRVDFFDRLPLLKIKTFSSMVKTKSMKVSGQEVIVRADNRLFVRMLVVAQTRAMDIQEVLRDELGPLPWSMAAVDGTLGKTTRPNFCRCWKKVLPQRSKCRQVLHGLWMEWLFFKPSARLLLRLQISLLVSSTSLLAHSSREQPESILLLTSTLC